MSKGIKKIVSIAAPIIGSVVGGPVGGMIGGAIGGAVNGGGLKGAVLGAASGYLSSGSVGNLVGTAAGTPVSATIAGPTYGSGIMGAVTGGGMRALTSGVSNAASSIITDPTKLLLGVGNQLMGEEAARTAEDAAKIQSDSINGAIAANQNAVAPYTTLGANAVNKIGQIEADPAGYVQNNELYKSLADDATRRLLANQAAKGKVGSGGTAAALQEQLLTLGTGLVNNDVNRLSNQAGIGATSANNVGTNTANLMTAQGDVNAAGKVGSYNATNAAWQNQINTILAMQGLQKAPVYSPSISL